MAFGLSGALAGLSATNSGYVQGRMDENKADLSDIQLGDAKRQQLAKVAMGNALALLGAGGGQQPPDQMMRNPNLPPAPGQPSQPMGPPGGAPGGQQAGGPPPGGPRPDDPNSPMNWMGARVEGGGPGITFGGGAQPGGGQRPMPGGMPPGGGGAQPGGGMPPGGGMQPGGMPGGRPGGGMPGGQQPMDWRSIIFAIKQANPNAAPDVIAEAVNQFMPFMTVQSQTEWRQISLQLREQTLLQREEQMRLTDEQRRAAEAGRDRRADQTDERVKAKDKAVEQRFERRESRLDTALKLREDTTWARLEQQKQAAVQRVEASQGRQGLAEARAVIDAQNKHITQRIQAYSQNNTMSVAERKKLLDEADENYRAQIDDLKSRASAKPVGGGAPAPSPAAPAPTGAMARPAAGAPKGDKAPVPDETPAAFGGDVKDLKEGFVTDFGPNGKWTLKGGKPVQVP